MGVAAVGIGLGKGLRGGAIGGGAIRGGFDRAESGGADVEPMMSSGTGCGFDGISSKADGLVIGERGGTGRGAAIGATLGIAAD